LPGSEFPVSAPSVDSTQKIVLPSVKIAAIRAPQLYPYVNLSTSPPASNAPSIPPENVQWFAEQVYAHDTALKGYLRSAFPTVRDVEDIVQESYLRVWRRQLARPITFAKGFLFKVARRLALDSLRRTRSSPFNVVTDIEALHVIYNGQDATESACTKEEVEVLLAAIESLSHRCREIVILRKLQGMSQKEIALKLGLSEQTIQVQARRGLRRCDQYLRRHGVNRLPLT